ncbi:kinesin-like protein KIN-7G [Copidosoma floridanum]|uniref:kinesin-like protein KIN-7G n=1 Tax=Copidosoma floridanum TaxID=29053 RepID=UPI0006C9A9C2|nr:kinesin-like protein KIN-7G [Copidosoma floridanum]
MSSSEVPTNVQVAIRVRPLMERELKKNQKSQWTLVDKIINSKKRKNYSFQFDHVFDPREKNVDVFQSVVRPVVDATVKGFHGTVFAYGQASSGKTHTMLGTLDEPGMISMAVERLFDVSSEYSDREYIFHVSYFEIYNEKINDLLDAKRVNLELRDNHHDLVQVCALTEKIVTSPELVIDTIKTANENRKVTKTSMSHRSNNGSHVIFRVTIKSWKQSNDPEFQISQLNLVDLADPGGKQDFSIPTFELVIKQLSEFSGNNVKYVNFGGSKLTRLFKASLGDLALTAKSVKNKPKLNKVASNSAVELEKCYKKLEKLNHEKQVLLNNMLMEKNELEKNDITPTKNENSSKVFMNEKQITWLVNTGQDPTYENLRDTFSKMKNIPSSNGNIKANTIESTLEKNESSDDESLTDFEEEVPILKKEPQESSATFSGDVRHHESKVTLENQESCSGLSKATLREIKSKEFTTSESNNSALISLQREIDDLIQKLQMIKAESTNKKTPKRESYNFYQHQVEFYKNNDNPFLKLEFSLQ